MEKAKSNKKPISDNSLASFKNLKDLAPSGIFGKKKKKKHKKKKKKDFQFFVKPTSD